MCAHTCSKCKHTCAGMCASVSMSVYKCRWASLCEHLCACESLGIPTCACVCVCVQWWGSQKPAVAHSPPALWSGLPGCPRPQAQLPGLRCSPFLPLLPTMLGVGVPPFLEVRWVPPSLLHVKTAPSLGLRPPPWTLHAAAEGSLRTGLQLILFVSPGALHPGPRAVSGGERCSVIAY